MKKVSLVNLAHQNAPDLDWLPRLPPLDESGEFDFLVSPPSTTAHFQIHLGLKSLETQSSALKCDNIVWHIRWNSHEATHPVRRLFSALIDGCVAASVLGIGFDLLRINEVDKNHVHVVSFSRLSLEEGRIFIQKLQVPSSVDIDYALQPEESKDLILRSYEGYKNWLSNDPFSLKAGIYPNQMLVVSVDPNQLWFLKYPLTLYVRFQLEGFAYYNRIQWIVTNRSFAENAINRQALTQLLTNTVALVKGTVIVVNGYEEHFHSAVGNRVRTTIAVLSELLGQFKNVYFEDDCFSLRWALNPSAEILEHLLTNSDTKLFYGAFEAGAGKWQLADKISSQITGQDPPQRIGTIADFYDLEKLRGQLKHIQLLRIFHCNSIFDPYMAATQGSEPADRNTIARQLLETDAQFIEGGMTKESYFDFACAVIQLFFQTGLRLLLESRAAEGKLDLDSIIGDCNKILVSQGVKPISR